MSNFNKNIETVEASLFLGTNALEKHNITINDTRTSVKLEPRVWHVLKQAAAMEGCTVNDLCSFIYNRKGEGSSLASAIRVFLIAYLDIKLQTMKK